MPIKILMPALSPTMKSGNIAKWIKQAGDAVEPGDVLLEIETDKATMEVESIDSGVLAKVLIPEGSQDVSVNSLIAVLKEGEETDADIEQYIKEHREQGQASSEPEKPEEERQVSIQSAQVNTSNNQERIFISPAARKIAKDRNIDISSISPTGPNGRIIKQDVLSYSGPSAKSESAEIVIPISPTRRVIATRLSDSKKNIPHFYITIDCILDNINELRKKINNKEKGIKISINDFIIKASAVALQEVKEINSSWQGGKILQYQSSDICVAVAAEEGVITPIVFKAEEKSLSAISAEVKNLAALAKEGRLKTHQYAGGSFTISNLGMYGVDSFSAIINPPQAAILAVGGAKKSVVPNCKGEIVIRDVMSVTLSCDHRVVDGDKAALWLSEFKRCIENPYTMLI